MLPSRLPVGLSLTAAESGLYTRSGIQYTYAIGKLPFLSAASREHPIIRESAPIRKQQFDSQPTPGEQSLDGWWLRSQQSFHGGAGQLFADPTSDNSFSAIRYRTSRNVNVWDLGRASLLHNVAPASGSPIAGVTDMTEFDYGDGTGAAFGVAGSNYVLVRSGAVTVVSFAAVDVNPLQSVTTDGSRIFVSNIAGVWSAPIPASAPGTFTWTKQYNISTSAKTFMAFVKARIILAVGSAIYELNPYPATPPAALPTAKYTASDPNWVWTGITESGTAIYVVGNNGVRGLILKFVLTSTGDVPTLTGGAVAAQLPSGEVTYSAIGYLGSFVAIGTNKGVRVGVSNEAGDITYGPILFESDGPVRAWTARDRFLWCTVPRGSDGQSGLYRVDLSLQVAELRFPYAPDLVAADTTDCVSVANLGSSDLIAFSTTDDLYVEDATVLAASGYLQTSRVRFSTLEPKLFKLLGVRGPILRGPLAFAILDTADNQVATHTFPEGEAPHGDMTISSPLAPVDYISVKFVLTRDDVDSSAAGELTGYQVKALPGARRQRLIQLPLWCFDWETDPVGNRVGGAGTAGARLAALEDVETSGNSVTLQDFGSGTNTQCVIERLSFSQTAPPSGFAGWGGIVTLTLRTI